MAGYTSTPCSFALYGIYIRQDFSMLVSCTNIDVYIDKGFHTYHYIHTYTTARLNSQLLQLQTLD